MEPDIASPIKKEKDSEIVKEVNADIAKFIVEVDALIKLYKIRNYDYYFKPFERNGGLFDVFVVGLLCFMIIVLDGLV